MTNERKTITVSKETFERLQQHRDVPWDEFQQQFIDWLEAESRKEPLTTEHITDIATETAQQTSNELETRLR